MKRRTFLQLSSAAAAATAFPWRGALAQSDDWKTYEIVTRVEVLAPRGATQAWVPLPLTEDTPWFKSVGSTWSGNTSAARLVSDGKYGASMLHAQWREGE